MAVSTFSKESKDKSTEVKACAPSTVGMKETIQDLASVAAQSAQDVASTVNHKAKDWAANVANKAQETASAAVDKTDDGIAAVGHQLNALSGTVRKAASQDGAIGSAATTVADQLQAGGKYLEEHGIQDIGNDLTNLVRQHPIPSVLLGLGLGYLLGMSLGRR